MKVAFYTLGCKLNQAETEELKNDPGLSRDFSVVGFGEDEDVVVVRACGVTVDASQTTREMIRRAKRRGAYVIAVGCLENKDLPEIDFVAKDNEDVIARLRDFSAPSRLCRDSGRNDIHRTRALIKIQTGCNFNCAYCVIPSFRGRARSVPTEKIITKIKGVETDGYKEITLTGVNICQYKDKKIDLSGLLEKILAKTKSERVRLGSLDPRLITDKLIKLFSSEASETSACGRFRASAENMPRRGLFSKEMDSRFHGNDRLMPHWHLSLQSGSDTVLERMRRGYTAKQYLEIVQKMRHANPLFSFTTDIIVGFPGETEKEFKQTCAFVKKIGFAKVHVFPFSPRPGTPAAKMPGQVQDKIKTERVKKLIKISEQEAKKFAKKFISKTRPVLFENKKSGYSQGYTPEFVRVKYKSEKNLKNKIAKIKITSSTLQ